MGLFLDKIYHKEIIGIEYPSSSLSKIIFTESCRRFLFTEQVFLKQVKMIFQL